ncbi:MAG: hypothetical protein RLZZ273_1920 [Bacteroidota bacterium]|jgi:hypothetical protein
MNEHRVSLQCRTAHALLYLILIGISITGIRASDEIMLSLFLSLGLGLFIVGALGEFQYLVKGNPPVWRIHDGVLEVSRLFRKNTVFSLSAITIWEYRPVSFWGSIMITDGVHSITLSQFGLPQVMLQSLVKAIQTPSS